MSKKETIIEAVWKPQPGMAAVVIMTGQGHRCGYVGVLPGHSLHGVDYSENTFALLPPPDDAPIGKRGVFTLISGMRDGIVSHSPEMAFDVHGGLTFSGKLKINEIEEHLGEFDVWWFGYDCAHCDDAPSPEHVQKMKEQYPDKPFMWGYRSGVYRTHDYCVAECNSLAQQIKDLTAAPWRAWLRRVFHAIRT